MTFITLITHFFNKCSSLAAVIPLCFSVCYWGMYITCVVQPSRQLWWFLKTDRKVKHFGSLLSESIYDLGGNFVYLKHSPTEDIYICPLHLSKSDTHTSNRNFHVSPCSAYYKSFLLELTHIEELEQRHAWSLNVFISLKERIFKNHVLVHIHRPLEFLLY